MTKPPSSDPSRASRSGRGPDDAAPPARYRRDADIARIDPRDLIGESYRIEGIGPEDCRSIFFDWAIGAGEGAGTAEGVRRLLDHYGPGREGHPMTAVLREGLETLGRAPGRRGGRRRRTD